MSDAVADGDSGRLVDATAAPGDGADQHRARANKKNGDAKPHRVAPQSAPCPGCGPSVGPGGMLVICNHVVCHLVRNFPIDRIPPLGWSVSERANKLSRPPASWQ